MQVVAVAADEVELQLNFLAVNGRIVDRSPHPIVDGAGRPMQRFPFGHHVVGTGQVWLLGVYRERSWDSRYFVPIPAANIVARAVAAKVQHERGAWWLITHYEGERRKPRSETVGRPPVRQF